MNRLCFNGEIMSAYTPLLTAQNRGFRYGDGLFETMKVYRGKILFEALHFERLMTGMKLMEISAGKNFSPEVLSKKAEKLYVLNNCSESGRVRLAVWRNENNEAEYAIETFLLTDDKFSWQAEGWNMAIYPHARKSTDAFANIKSANYLPYVMAAKYAAEKGVDECLVLNTEGNICDGSRTNIFLIKGDEIFTPSLTQGCVSGVMRRYLVDALKKQGYVVHQAAVTEEMLLDADEVFVTNAIISLRWVQKFREKTYGNELTEKIYETLFAPLFV